MMLFQKYFLIVTLLISNLFAFAQTKAVQQLEQKITQLNDVQNYEASVQLISDFIDDDSHSAAEKFYAYIFKSYTYKRIFNYQECLHNLELADQQAKQSVDQQKLLNIIKAEQAFVYFDTHDYKKAAALMQDLAADDYKYLVADAKAFIIMQEGYLLFLDKKYAASDAKLNIALALILKFNPRNAPNIYGKKIELYNAMNLLDKRDNAFARGMKYAKKHQIIKYELYLYELMTKQHQNNKDFRNAFETQKKFDSLNLIYNSINNNGKIQILEKEIENNKKQVELQHEKNVRYFLIVLVFVFIILFSISLRLFIINKQKRVLVENENKRMFNEIELLTKSVDEKGNKRLDLSQYELTSRQKEIIGYIQEGFSNKEISAKLFISENTIKYHLKIIYNILDIAHRIEIK